MALGRCPFLLFVEDDQALRYPMTVELERAGFPAHEATTDEQPIAGPDRAELPGAWLADLRSPGLVNA